MNDHDDGPPRVLCAAPQKARRPSLGGGVRPAPAAPAPHPEAEARVALYAARAAARLGVFDGEPAADPDFRFRCWGCNCRPPANGAGGDAKYPPGWEWRVVYLGSTSPSRERLCPWCAGMAREQEAGRG